MIAIIAARDYATKDKYLSLAETMQQSDEISQKIKTLPAGAPNTDSIEPCPIGDALHGPSALHGRSRSNYQTTP